MEKTSEFSPALAARVQGRLTYAEAQCSGRWLAPLLDPIKRRALLPRSVRWLSEDIRGALLQCERMLSSAPAREIDTIGREPPCIVFTDGAFENDVASCGAVIFSPRVKEVLVFGFIIPDEIVKDWRKYGAEQLIAQAEMLPIAIVKRQMGNLLHRARVLYFIDNDGVKEAMVKGTTNSPACKKILVECMLQDATNHSMSWYSRIPSPSNISDGPSRLDFSEVEAHFVQYVTPKLNYEDWGITG